MATLHLMLTLRNGKVLEHFNDFTDQFVKKAGHPYPEVVDGYFHPPEGPGWGVELDMDFIRKHPPTEVDGIIQDPGLNMFVKANWAARDGR
jgi:galactonate dehydratase